MNSSIEVKPKVNRLINFLSDIEKGRFKIPTFQRDFVWGNREKLDLFDSISRGYPIGSILLWEPIEQFKNKDYLGPYKLGVSENKDFFYILDGFQRLSTLFGCLTNPTKTRLEVNKEILEKEYCLCYDIEDETFIFSNKPENITLIPLFVFIDTFALLDWLDKFRTSNIDNELVSIYVERAKKLSSTLIDFQIPSIEVIGGSIKEAIDIFSRINSKGILISSDWMLSALTSNEELGFNLADELSILIDELVMFNFQDIKREVLVQCIQSSFGKIYFDQNLEDLAKRIDFKDHALLTIGSIKKSIKFLFEELLVLERKLLPYNNQLVFLTIFFNNVPEPTNKQISRLKEWFWITTYSNYFTVYSLSKIRSSFQKFQSLINNEDADFIYYDKSYSEFVTADLPKNISAKSVRSNAFILFQLNYENNFNKISINNKNYWNSIPIIKGDSSHENYIQVLSNEKIGISFSEFYGEWADSVHKFSFFLKDDDVVLILNNIDNLGIVKEQLKDRLQWIKDEESAFVQGLGIKYTNI